MNVLWNTGLPNYKTKPTEQIFLEKKNGIKLEINNIRST